LVLLNYEDFARAASSLLIQLVNLDRHKEWFGDFYRACYELRTMLATPLQEIKNDSRRHFLREVFVGPEADVWEKLINYVENVSTTEFSRHFGLRVDEADLP